MWSLSTTGRKASLHLPLTLPDSAEKENSDHLTSQDGSPWIFSGLLWTKGNGMNWPPFIQYAKGSFLCAGISAVTSSCFKIETTKKHLKRQTNTPVYFRASEAECSKTVP